MGMAHFDTKMRTILDTFFSNDYILADGFYFCKYILKKLRTSLPIVLPLAGTFTVNAREKRKYDRFRGKI